MERAGTVPAMNSLATGFFYIVGLSWALTECGVQAGNGNWAPLIIFVIFFILMFALLGCLPISNKSIETLGTIFAVLLGIGLIALSIHTSRMGNAALGGVKFVFAALFLITPIVGALFSSKSNAH